MSLKLYLFVVTCAVVLNAASGSIFGDFFKWDIMSAFSDGEGEEEVLKREEEESSIQNSCTCYGMKCDCCVDFNISNVIDLGGPGCVNMKYISKEEGVLLNVSYGDSVLHSQTVTNQNKKGTCMSLVTYLAEICARFSDLKESGDGMVGCLNFEPTFLGEVTAQYPVGCFHMSPSGMIVDNSLGNFTESEDTTKENISTPKPEEEEQSFIEAVNQSAQEGLEFISNLLGIDINVKKNTKNTTDTSEQKTRNNKGLTLETTKNYL